MQYSRLFALLSVVVAGCSGSKKPTDQAKISDAAQDGTSFAPESDAATPANVFYVNGQFDSKWDQIPPTQMAKLDNAFSPSFVGNWQFRFQAGTCALEASTFDPKTFAIGQPVVIDSTLITQFTQPIGSCSMTLATRADTVLVQTCGNAPETYQYTIDTSNVVPQVRPGTSNGIWTEGYNWNVPYSATDAGPMPIYSPTLSQVWVDPQEPSTIDPVLIQANSNGNGYELASTIYSTTVYSPLSSANTSVVVCGGFVYEVGNFSPAASTTVDDWALSTAADAGDATPIMTTDPLAIPDGGIPFADNDNASSLCANGIVYSYDSISGATYGWQIQGDGSLGAWFQTAAQYNGSPMQIVAIEPEFIVATNAGNTYVGYWQRAAFGTTTTSDAQVGDTNSDAADASDSEVAADTVPTVTVTPFNQGQCTPNGGTWCASLNACLPNTGCHYFCQGTTADSQIGIQCFDTKPSFSLVCDPLTVLSACP